MNYTANYQLPQWVETDRVLMDDFNDSYQKIETALSGLDTALAAKADSADLTSLAGTVDDHTDALEEKGNCGLSVLTYVGDGIAREDLPMFFTCDQRPVFVLIVNEDNSVSMRLAYGTAYAQADNCFDRSTVIWEDNRVTWYANAANAMMNESGVKYRAFIFLYHS